ncbi:head maturation protease, ClpP-related [Streptomyces sp. NPDC096048]|uniref:head maturation protease, ClpP-related n=1 Tax=Streptomyces sp. NPDC096048 TaxID=3366072 RepID=UPI00382B5D90
MPFDPSKIRARLASEKKPYSIRNLAGGEADVMLYGEIGWLGTTADEFVADIKALSASQINLHLSSPGGSVFDGIAIMNALRAHPAPVTVYVDSLAASIASVIAMAGDRIVARQGAEFMIHEAAGLSVGNADEMREMAELLDRQSDKIAGIYAARAGGSVEDWRAAMKRETWFSAQEAVDAGLADEVDQPTRESERAPGELAVAASWDLSVFRYAGREQAPAPEPVALERESHTLHGDIRTLIGEEVATQLAAAVAPPAEPVVETTPVEPEPEPPATEPEAEEPAAVDEWAAMTAHLTQDEPDAWSVLVSTLTTTASSSAATEA